MESTERRRAISETVDRIRELEGRLGVTRAGVEAIREELQSLAAHKALFPLDAFAQGEAPRAGTPRLYRLSEDPDHRFALYANLSDGDVDSPPHNHTTWAVVVGIQGEELNRFYRRTEDGGIEVTHEVVVTRGTGVALLPDDLHSIHIHGDEPVLNFHMYGLALPQLDKREYFDSRRRSWQIFPALREIHDAGF